MNAPVEEESMTTCCFCHPRRVCAADVWRNVIDQIIWEVEQDLSTGDASNGEPPTLISNNLLRKEVYRRLARERGFIGARYKFEACIIGNIRDAFPRRAEEPEYMGHREN